MSTSTSPDLDALSTVVSALKLLDADDQRRVLESAALFLGVSGSPLSTPTQRAPNGARSSGATQSFTDPSSMTPKEFLLEKQPRTDVERIACLAFYLTHYRDIPHFKTLELSKLNTEAAQPKFGNAAYSANNALQRGYLVQASKGKRQLSAGGEQFVQSLPDRDAARAAMARSRPKKTKPSKKAAPKT